MYPLFFELTSNCRSFWHATQDCVAPYVNHILYRDRFWAISTASGSVRLWDLRSCCMVLSHVMRGVLEVSSSPLEGELTGSSWHLCCRPYAQCGPKGSGDVTSNTALNYDRATSSNGKCSVETFGTFQHVWKC